MRRAGSLLLALAAAGLLCAQAAPLQTGDSILPALNAITNGVDQRTDALPDVMVPSAGESAAAEAAAVEVAKAEAAKAALVTACSGTLRQDFNAYLVAFKKTYKEDEFAQRCAYFAESAKYVKSHPKASLFTVALNKYADWSPAELKALGGALPVQFHPLAALAREDAGAATPAAAAPATTRRRTQQNGGATAPAAVAALPAAVAVPATPTTVVAPPTTAAPRYNIDLHGVNPPQAIQQVTSRKTALPKHVDYRTNANPYHIAALTPVVDQGRCASSWAMTATALAETRMAMETTAAPEVLSAQQLLNCVDAAFTCEVGGNVAKALEYVNTHGLGLEANKEDNAYKAKKGVCVEEVGQRELIGALAEVDHCAQRDLMKALYYLGPVAARVKSSCQAFWLYSGGILDDTKCLAMEGATAAACASAVDHDVLIVGYDKDASTGTDYWIVRNSFGAEWGEGGYARLKMDTRGLCGNACVAAFPITAISRELVNQAGGMPLELPTQEEEKETERGDDDVAYVAVGPVHATPREDGKLLDPSGASSSKGLSTIKIIGAAVGSVSGAAFIALVAFTLVRRGRPQSTSDAMALTSQV